VLVRVVFVVALLVVLVRHQAVLVAGVRAMGDADASGVLATAILVGSTYVFAAVSLAAASGRPLPLGRTALTQLSGVCANRVTPAGLGAMGVNLRYLEESGASRAEGLAAIGLSGVVTFLVRLATAIAVVVVAGHSGLDAVVHLAPAQILLVLGALAVAGAFAVRRRRDLLESARGAWSSVSGVRRSPGRILGLLVGSGGTTAAHALSFVTAAHACGVRLSAGSLLIVYLGGSAVGAASPAMAGLGSVEAALVAGLAGLGVDPSTAMASALTFRLVTYWMPVGPSLLALWWTRSRRSVAAALEPEPEPRAEHVPAPALLPMAALVPVSASV
jgi:undecaprenyl-diphosphatase